MDNAVNIAIWIQSGATLAAVLIALFLPLRSERRDREIKKTVGRLKAVSLLPFLYSMRHIFDDHIYMNSQQGTKEGEESHLKPIEEYTPIEGSIFGVISEFIQVTSVAVECSEIADVVRKLALQLYMFQKDHMYYLTRQYQMHYVASYSQMNPLLTSHVEKMVVHLKELIAIIESFD